MDKNLTNMEQPLNSGERFLHAIAHRLNIIIEQNNSIIDHLAKQDKVAVTNHKSEEKQPESQIATKGTAEDKQAEAKPEPKKRSPRKKKED